MTGVLIGFNGAAVVLTMIGGFVPFFQNLFSKRWLWRIFSLRSGILLSIAFVEILPHSWEYHPTASGWGALFGFALLYGMESVAMSDSCPEYLEDCSVHLMGWGALSAMFLHSFIDGLNLSISFSAGALAGTAIGSAIALHKLIDGFTLTSLLVGGGYTKRNSMFALILIAMATPLGSLLGILRIHTLSPPFLGALLGFAAGCFVYIGASDVLTRLHKTDDKGCLMFFFAGLLAIASLRGVIH